MKRILAALMMVSMLGAPAVAQNWANQFSPGQARDSEQRGQTVRLSQVVQNLKRQYGGELLQANMFSQRDNKMVYKIDWLAGNGRKMSFTVDAETGRILDQRGG